MLQDTKKPGGDPGFFIFSALFKADEIAALASRKWWSLRTGAECT
ncbi:Hypothetical protein OINT_2001356 [Brucella intermedia LMG 3301]|uniref:Uncharacterized protein n=1 Tax=Brucella intermedia LMG 3301 TaxID=641118 RepID=C4WPN3_9HYPH|nr:Hypothetical protein OINT_2001356 [Brucella intermedia LMG 3301]